MCQSLPVSPCGVPQSEEQASCEEDMSQVEPGGSWDTLCPTACHAMNMFRIDWQGRLVSASGHPVSPELAFSTGIPSFIP